MNEPLEKPSLIIDSDWKDQVEKEKAAASLKSTSTSTAEPAEEPVPSTSAKKSDTPIESMPPPGITFLVSMLFTQAMAFLGQIPDPVDQESRVDKMMAKHTIDTLDALQQKTVGNLDDNEKQMLTEALHILRMAYVNCRPA